MNSNTQQTSELSNAVESGGYDGSTNLGTIASQYRNIRRELDRHDNLGSDVPMDAHWLTTGEHWFQTPSGELVYMSAKTASDGDEGEVYVLFPERESLDEKGHASTYSYVTTIDRLMARMDADGGWTLINRFEQVSTPKCRGCSRFVSVGEDNYGFPFAQCRCGCDMDVDDLMEQNAVVEVF